METRLERIERKIDELLMPYREATGRYRTMFDAMFGDYNDFDNETDYNYIYANRSSDHVTSLVTETKCEHMYHVLLLVTSKLDNFEQRQSIRVTWGEDPISVLPRWKTYFLVGRSKDNNSLRKIAREMRTYRDVILGDTFEDFYNLTFKLQMGFEWSYKYCNYKFLLKGDDDIFINVPRLFAFVNHAETPRVSLYAGNVHYAAIVSRSGRYGVSKKEYKKKIYPRYCSGGGFVLTRDVVKKFIDSLDSVDVLKIDDAYVGELALKSGVDVYHDDNFQMFENSKRCLFKQNTIVHHPVNTKECMEILYERTLLPIIAMSKIA